ncbi:hypothetical protein MASR2M78_34730 [Treponema sp.]
MYFVQLCATKPDNISVDENVNLAKAKAITDQYNIVIGGNLPLTTIMLLGNQQDNMKGVIDLMDSLTPGNWIAAPGCDMPYDTPIENCVAAGQAIRESARCQADAVLLTPILSSKERFPITRI